MNFAFIAQAGAQGGSGGFLGFLPFILIMVIVYFMMIRPQMKKQKDHTKMLKSLGKNDDVVTSGGIHGKIIRINDKDASLQLLIAKGIIVTVERSSVSRVREGKSQEPKQIASSPEKSEEAKPVRNVRREPQKRQGSPQKQQPKAKPAGKAPESEQGVVTSSTGSGEARKPRSRRSRPYRGSRGPKRPTEQSKDGQ
ncbi:preprotein translocase subunit YajC [candidate division LCP-89 bacterium B3_LCP]|uniref:Sec translocon accessory complex subunit YajC n=1 Tax=candidate division LCP-89 bacterium B3_LCP TaxID=2012998 RepID=A0A532V3K6_UNCL8|nr:MAG: preprotein translocase subunit YajC [candidate division LCP-89 bacterium B3_LCP]